MHLRISIHQTINKATKLGTKEESNEVKNVLKLRWFSHLRWFFFGLGWFWDWRVIKVPIAQEDRDRQEIGRSWVPKAVLRPVRSTYGTRIKVSRHRRLTVVGFVLFSWFFHPIRSSFPIDFERRVGILQIFFLAVVFHFRRAMEVKGPWQSSLEHTAKASISRLQSSSVSEFVFV